MIFARHTSCFPGSTRRVNRSHSIVRLLFVHGTSTVSVRLSSRPSCTSQARTVNPPRCSSPTFTLTGHCVLPGSVQKRESVLPACDTSTSARPRS